MLVANNTTFEDAYSSMYGGAINSQGKLTIDNCTFSNNVAQCGGAIYIKGNDLIIKNSVFLNNNATLYGGAITTVRSNVDLINITAGNNRAEINGGVIYSIYDQFQLSNSTFYSNAAEKGAAVFVDASKFNIIENNTFTDNAPLDCGTLYMFYNRNSTIKGNTYSSEDDLFETCEINMFIGNGNYTLYNYNASEITVIPSAYDLRDYGYVTPVKSQGVDGNCWAFATMATLESCILKASGGAFDLSESNMKNLFGNYSDFGWVKLETNKGGYASTGFNYLVSWMGPVLEEDDPYAMSSLFSKIFNSILHVQNVLFIQRTSLDDIDYVKKIIMTYGAVYSQIHTLKTKYQYFNGNNGGNHAISIVGWNDSLVFAGAPANGGWIYKNSWGSSSGDDGYYYVSYYDTSCLPIDKIDGAFTFILDDTIKFDKNYQYDIQGKSDFFYNSSSTVWYKNIFNATDDEYLAAVSTYFDENANYTFSIYVNNQFKLTQSGSSRPGYYTFNLNELIPLKKGDSFEIVFNISVASNAGVPVSENVSFVKYYYKPNTSFISYDGVNWKDLYDLKWKFGTHTYYSSVACIKAFTVYDMINTTLRLVHEITNEENVYAIVLNQYNRPVTGGNVTFTVNGEKKVVPVVKGIANIRLLEVGEYNISAIYNNNGYISSQDGILSVKVSMMDTTINITVSEHNPADIIVQVLNNKGYPINYGNVTLNIDGEILTINITDYQAKVTKIFEKMGQHNVSVSFRGMPNFKPSYGQKSFNISLINTNLTVAVDSDFYARNINVKVTDQYGKAVDYGTVTFNVKGKEFNVKVANGIANFNNVFDLGLNEITITYNGLYIYNSSNEKMNITVHPTIFSNDEKKTLNSQYIINMLDQNGNPLNKTKVNIVIKSKTYNLISDENGNVVLTIDLTPGDYELKIINPLSGEVKNQNIQVLPRIAENNGMTMYYGAGKYFKVKAFDDNGNIAKGVKVKFTLAGKTYTQTTDSKGYASIKISSKPGTYTVTVEYKGFKASNKIKVKTTIITKNKSFKKGKVIKFTAKLLSSKGKILKGKKITFKFNGKTYKIKTNKKGIATLKITKKLKVGKYKITSKYGKLTVKNTIKIKK